MTWLRAIAADLYDNLAAACRWLLDHTTEATVCRFARVTDSEEDA